MEKEEVQTQEPKIAEETPTAVATAGVESAKPDEAIKSFTQAELDEIVKQRIARAREKWEKKEPDSDLQNQIKQLSEKLQNYEMKEKLVAVDDEFKDYVGFKVQKMVKEDKPFEDALKEYLEGEGKKYVKVSSPPVKATPRPSNSNGPMTDQDYIANKYGNRTKPLNRQ